MQMATFFNEFRKLLIISVLKMKIVGLFFTEQLFLQISKIFALLNILKYWNF